MPLSERRIIDHRPRHGVDELHGLGEDAGGFGLGLVGMADDLLHHEYSMSIQFASGVNPLPTRKSRIVYFLDVATSQTVLLPK